MRLPAPLTTEIRLAGKFAAVSMVGFLLDALALRIGLGLGLTVAVSRLLSLGVALQATFLLSRAFVFHVSERSDLLGQWWRFMIANGFGGLCNFWVYLFLMGFAWAGPFGFWAPLLLSASSAYVINYAGARLFVYGRELAEAGVVGRDASRRRTACLDPP
jgi:putative flippase GtrA